MMSVVLFDRAAVGDRHHDGVRQAGVQQPIQRELLTLVDRRGGFVEEDHLRFVQDHPGERDALLLAGGERLGPIRCLVELIRKMSQCHIVECGGEPFISDLGFDVRIRQHRPKITERQVGHLGQEHRIVFAARSAHGARGVRPQLGDAAQ